MPLWFWVALVAGTLIEAARNALHTRWYSVGVFLGIRPQAGIRRFPEWAFVALQTAIYVVLAAAALVAGVWIGGPLATIVLIGVGLRAVASIVHGANCVIELRQMAEAAQLAAEHQARREQVEHQ
jgi:hypothetical protein